MEASHRKEEGNMIVPEQLAEVTIVVSVVEQTPTLVPFTTTRLFQLDLDLKDGEAGIDRFMKYVGEQKDVAHQERLIASE